MSGSGQASSFPVPPPLAKLPWSTTTDGKLTYLTNPSYNFLLQLWAGLQGGGGLIPSLVSVPFPTITPVTAFSVVTINGAGQAASPNLTVISDGLGIIGVSTSASSGGTAINVQPVGIVTNSAWTWTSGVPVWCGVAGALTQTAPSTPGQWVRKIGVAVSATAMEIQIGELVELT